MVKSSPENGEAKTPPKTKPKFEGWSAMTAVNLILISPTRGQRGFWMVTLVLAVCLMTYEITNIFIQYRNEPYATLVKTQEMNHFPVIGICPRAQIDPRAAVKANMTMEDIAFLHAVLPEINSELVDKALFEKKPTQEQQKRITEIASRYKSRTEAIKALGLNMGTFLNIECPLCIKKVPKIRKHVKSSGICYIISPGPVKPVKVRGRVVPEVRISYQMSAAAKQEIDEAYDTLWNLDYGDYSDYNYYNDNYTYNNNYTNYPVRKRRTAAPTRSKRGHLLQGVLPGPGVPPLQYGGDPYALPLPFVNDSWTEGGKMKYEYEETPVIRVMFGDQAMSYDEYGDVKIAENMDATILLRIARKKLIHKSGKCLSASERQGQEFVPCAAVCENKGYADCGIECIDYLGEVYEKTVTKGNKTVQYCIPSDFLNLTSTATSCLSTLVDRCMSACVQPCDYFFYEPSILPSVDVARMTATGAMDIIVRPLHPESLLTMIEVEKYTWNVFLSNVGGFVSLFCGASVISVIHLFYSFCYGLKAKKQ